MTNKYAVIMAGGSGTRLWPISRQDHPKHIIPFLGSKSFFQTTVDRMLGIFQNDKVFIVTTRDQYEILHQQVPWIKQENFILEPEPKGTASVAGLAAAVINSRDPEAIMALFPSDHHIANTDLFADYMNTAFKVAEKDFLVTMGINPTYPATGYGYIQGGELIKGEFNSSVFRVLKFQEKPDELQARVMLESKDHSWNSGIFIWTIKRILQEIDQQMPDLRTSLNEIMRFWDQPDMKEQFAKEWSKLKTQTIDYGIMENASNVTVIPTSDLGWNDIGSWDSLFEILKPDINGNIVFNSNYLSMESQSSLVYGNTKDKLVATIGVKDLIIVDSGDVLLICKKGNSQLVKDAVKSLIGTKQKGYL